MSKKAVVVFSGGLDSTTCLGLAHQQGYELYALTFHYGQRHNREVEQAKQIAKYYHVKEHRIVLLDFLKEIGGSALTDQRLEVPDQGVTEGIPITYVPARNLIFLSVATAWAEVVQAEKIMIGVSAVDYSGYPDCRPQFIESMNRTVQLATKSGTIGTGIFIDAPLINLSKAETIALGMKLGVPYHLTTSCYKGEAMACGQCDSCRLRIKGFKEAGFKDPIPYAITINW
jgi:7-cyano-7-deazaguanine synthase